MLSTIRYSLFVNFLWGFLGLFLLNISVDISDPNPDFIPEDLSFNDQESIVEIFVEKFLGYENAFEEHDEHDTEDQNKKKNLKVDLLTQFFNDHTDSGFHTKEKLIARFAFDDFLDAGFFEIDSPPPKS